MTELERLLKARETLTAYLLIKAEQHDWHAVSDAANDLRELELKIRIERNKSGRPNE